jgi:hypothetical protein
VKAGREPIVHGGTWYVPAVQLHFLLIVGSQVHDVDTELEFGILESFSTTSDPIF